MKISVTYLTVASVCGFLTGCGGGAGGENTGSLTSTGGATTVANVPVATPVPVATDPAANPAASSGPVVPIASAITALYTTSRNFHRTETATGTADVYIFNRDFTVGAVASVEGTIANSVDIAGSILKNGALLISSAQTDYFLTSPYRLISRKFSQSPLYLVALNQQSLPATGKSGDTGKLYDAVTYDSSAKVNIVSTSTQAWTITPDTDASVTFCIVSTTSIAQIAGTTSKSDCYKIGADGTVALVAFVLPSSN